jgi:thioredoxin 1
MIELTDDSFEKEVLQSKIPVLVDFWAPWCGPCVSFSPILEKVSKDYNGKIKITKLNVQDFQEKAGEFSVMSIPNVKLFKNGEVVDEFVGMKSEADLKNWLDGIL